MNFAIIGLGFISKRHMDAIEHIKGKVLLACDTDESKILKIPTYRDYKDMPLDKEWAKIDAVVICTPNDTHIPIAKWALSQGKKVICEKPLSIASEDFKGIKNNKDIYAVMQLRHHPIMQEILEKKPREIELYVKVKRDESYWTGWKGDEFESGGILFNLGVHYFDVLLQLLGNHYEVISKTCTRREAEGEVVFAGLPKPVKYYVAIDDTDDDQDRFIMLDGHKFRFSNKDNLSFEDLHIKVYEDFLKGEGVRPSDLVPLTKFIEALK